MRVEALDRHHARETDRSREASQVHRRHPARGDLVEDRVATYLLLSQRGRSIGIADQPQIGNGRLPELLTIAGARSNVDTP